MNKTEVSLLMVALLCLAVLPAHVSAQPGPIDPLARAGESLWSNYSVTRKNGQQVVSAQLFDPYGKPREEPGQIIFSRTVTNVGTFENPRFESGSWDLNPNGRVWTPRVERLFGLDLATDGRIVDQEGFDWDMFTKDPAVIRFADAYAVNLYGARIQSQKIIGAGTEGAYLTQGGKKLPARLITRKPATQAPLAAGDKIVTTGPAPLKVGRQSLLTVEKGRHLVVAQVNGPWVGVRVQREGQNVTGWLKRDLVCCPSRELSEEILTASTDRE